LRVSSLAINEYEIRQQFIHEVGTNDSLSPAERLSMLMAEDCRLRIEERSGFRLTSKRPKDSTKHSSPQCYPETARWCLSSIKNLTRLCKDGAAAHVLIKTGVLDLILEYITIPKDAVNRPTSGECGSPNSAASDDTPTADPLDLLSENAPHVWNPNSVQDLALYIVLNLAACPTSRDYVFEANAFTVLSSIAAYSTRCVQGMETNPQQEFQSLKAVSSWKECMLARASAYAFPFFFSG